MALWRTYLRQLHDLSWNKLAGMVFFIAVMVAIMIGFERTVDGLARENAANVSRIVVTGDTQFISAEEVANYALNGMSRNFFKLNVDDIQENLIKLDWVDSASVQKRWPDALLVHITEQRPVATWNGDMLLNMRGELFIADQSRLSAPLPEFFGPAGSEQEVLNEFRQLGKLLTTSKISIDEVVLSERYAWQLRLNNAMRLHLGQEDRVQRIHRFLTVLPSILQSTDRQIDYIDLRYDTGMAVGWKQENNNENA